MISITVHNPTDITHHQYERRPSSDLIVRDTDGSTVALCFRSPDDLRGLARVASRAASELGAAMAEEVVA